MLCTEQKQACNIESIRHRAAAHLVVLTDGNGPIISQILVVDFLSKLVWSKLTLSPLSGYAANA